MLEVISKSPNLNLIVNSLQGWCSVQKAHILYDLVLKSDSQVSVELGVFGGRSLIPIALAHKVKDSGFVLGVDAWNKQASIEGDGASKDGISAKANDEWWSNVDYGKIYDGCSKAIDRYGLNNFCGTVKINSLTVGTLIKDNFIDLLHQDSNHSEEISCAEVELYFPKMKAGSYWICDDTDWTTTQKAQELLMDKGFTMVADYQNFRVFQNI